MPKRRALVRHAVAAFLFWGVCLCQGAHEPDSGNFLAKNGRWCTCPRMARRKARSVDGEDENENEWRIWK